ncbi:MAG TPA: hypothetical protein ENF55_04680, partial [Thermoprotei archaeon]|nr:hypothetical protein [Thermoprotei archaeon]
MFKRTLPTVYFLVLILLSVQLPVLSESQKIRRSESLKVSVNRYSLEGVVYKVIKAPEFGFVYITVRKLGRYIVYIFNSEGLLKVVNPYRPFFAYSSLLRALVSITRNNSKVVILDPLNLDIERSLASITRPPQATTPIDIICEGDKLVICYMGAFSAEGATRTGRMIQVYSLILGRELWHTRLKVGVYVDVYSCQFSPNGEYLVIHGTDTLCRICREWSDFIEIVKSTTGEKITNRDASKYGKSWYKALSEGVLISVENKYSRHKWQTIFIDYKGDLKWAFSKDDPTEKYYDAVEIDEAIIYSSITSKGQALGAIDKNTGSRLWRFEFSDSQPFKLDGAKDGRLIAANSDRATLYDIDGRKLWEYKFNDGYQVDYCLWIDS